MTSRLFTWACTLLLSTSAFAQTDYTPYISTITIGDTSVEVLRIPMDKITSDNVLLRGDIYNAQEDLKAMQKSYKEGKSIVFHYLNNVNSRCAGIEREDKSFPTKYYLGEYNALKAWTEAKEKREGDERRARIEAYKDSVRTVELKEGYMWINADSVWVLSKPDNKAAKIGRIYRLSYVHGYEVEGKPEWVEIKFGEHTGYVLEADMAFDWDEMLLSDEELVELKRGRYYDFDAVGAYKLKLQREAAEEERAFRAANAAPRRQYHKGPRGGCYYVDSKGSKQYVDHGFCR